jgi:hypothetical protein
MADPEKHERYNEQYKSNELFWGIGIENETYFQFSEPAKLSPEFIYNNHKPERYSVNYFVSLDPEYKTHLKLLYPNTQATHDIPIYMNGHTLQKTDLSGNHQTLFSKGSPPNPHYSGTSLLDVMFATNPSIFKDKYKVNYTFDGDTIEFMTQRFYKTTIQASIAELVFEKALFLQALQDVFAKNNLYQSLGTLHFPKRNEPFVKYLTNMENVASFNNGTYHLNFTIPTQLGSDAKPINPKEFVAQHKAAIRYIQFLEPLIIALYGTPDPFSEVSPKYSKASQRCAVSRYIGIGTYNTDTMETGKILTLDIDTIQGASNDFWWYKQFHKTSNYLPLPKIGVDINFAKHGVHGIEIRFLDWFPENRLHRLMETIVYLLDFSLSKPSISNPAHSRIWNDIVVKCLTSGRKTVLTQTEFDFYRQIFKIPNIKSDLSVVQVYAIIEHFLRQTKGPCVSYMVEAPK